MTFARRIPLAFFLVGARARSNDMGLVSSHADRRWVCMSWERGQP